MRAIRTGRDFVTNPIAAYKFQFISQSYIKLTFIVGRCFTGEITWSISALRMLRLQQQKYCFLRYSQIQKATVIFDLYPRHQGPYSSIKVPSHIT